MKGMAKESGRKPLAREKTDTTQAAASAEGDDEKAAIVSISEKYSGSSTYDSEQESEYESRSEATVSSLSTTLGTVSSISETSGDDLSEENEPEAGANTSSSESENGDEHNSEK
eukprot:gnl/TRDRNA2_/TRDRNA2_127403_c1_seq1.p1 gnl/TRDRNA2_/TRDRNA2_127403_c1~~gnl/TRDRNA2_/TRDRNA2_127403_c1_seq1.p1  ORF type:complete len:114 (+),score=23.44 gnl/TRDRNA2_/TRDRNA2_127403_c1_seq1:3-344(+)